MNISGSSIGSYYNGYYGNLSISDSKDGAASTSVSGKSSAKKQDSVQFSAEAMERFKESQQNGGTYDPSRVELSTDDKKQILERVKQDFGTETSDASEDSAAAAGTEKTEDSSSELTALKNALKSLDLDNATDDQINSAFTRLTSALKPSEGEQGRGPRGAGGPPPGGKPPGPPPGGMPPGGAGAAGQSDSTETTAQKLLEALTSAYDDEDDEDDSDDSTSSSSDSSTSAAAQTTGTTESKTDYAARLKEQLAKFRTESGRGLNGDVYELLLQKIDDWASPSSAGSLDGTDQSSGSGEEENGAASESV